MDFKLFKLIGFEIGKGNKKYNALLKEKKKGKLITEGLYPVRILVHQPFLFRIPALQHEHLASAQQTY